MHLKYLVREWYVKVVAPTHDFFHLLLTMKIGTHSGHFHADEALAVWMLKQLPEFANSQLVRSRNLEILDQCDIIVDVGGKYEAPKWYDHHQREFTTTFDANHTTTKLSSAGLVYKHYGKDVLKQIIGESVKGFQSNQDNSKKQRQFDVSEIADALYIRVYEHFIEAIDAMDNGVNAYTEQPKYMLRQMSLQSIVGNLSPTIYEDGSDENTDRQFVKASDLMGMAFAAEIRSSQLSWYFSRETVTNAYNDRFQYDPKGRILVLDDMASWKEHLETLEQENPNKETADVIYVLYPSGDSFRVQAVAKEPGSFESRKALPQPWRGVRDDQLSEVTGVPGGVFVHASGFIGGNKTREGALEMAKKAVDFA